ncbi:MULTISPECIES: DsbA family protein [unclassified Pseudovibrio]|uniref:DsbA family protein n=1 Tax=unclassified Pseudovibrio TaxID=2627060 RepID=UPI00070C9F8B|nr:MULTISPECIES: DsbA family protein [unclassified Pseudovibrio]KZL00416.1 Disulfide bond formation protein D precursor [Pseudovibrio sp. W74]KZL07416.1 Disulfide bond formation protein D precursor [Pseudovibrio sp. Ad14]
MNKLIRRAAITCAATFALLPATFSAQAETVNRAEVETIIKEYLVANPEIVLEALQELDKRRLAEEESARKGAISSLSDEIYNSDYQIVLGNPDGDVTLVELFDYNCGYCKRALSDLVRLVDEDKNLRVVLKEFPVLGKASQEAARVAIAVAEVAPDKYEDFHLALLGQPGRANLASSLKVAKDLGISDADLEKSMKSSRAAETFQEVFTIAEQLGITGTPSYILGEEVIVGAVGYDTLKEKIAAERE